VGAGWGKRRCDGLHQVHHAIQGSGNGGLFRFGQAAEGIRQAILQQGGRGFHDAAAGGTQGQRHASAILLIPFAGEQSLGFQAVHDAVDGAVGQIDGSAQGHQGHVLLFGQGMQTKQLGKGDGQIGMNLPGMQIHGPHDFADRAQNLHVGRWGSRGGTDWRRGNHSYANYCGFWSENQAQKANSRMKEDLWYL
jgi:hypothetical protein